MKSTKNHTAPIAQAHKAARRPKMTQAEQSAEFEKVAREHGSEGSEAEFNGVLRKLVKPAEPPAQ